MKLTIELVPQTCWFANVRSIVSRSEWDRLRQISYKKANYKCEICSGTGLNQGKRWPVECHEIFEYDDATHLQTLVGLISLCPRCHMVKHMGRSISVGKAHEASNHLQEVNDWTLSQAKDYVVNAFKQYHERSGHQWKLNASILVEEYGVDEKVIRGKSS